MSVAPVSELASVYGNLGRAAEAEAGYRRALAIFENIYGAEHPEVGQHLEQPRRRRGAGEALRRGRGLLSRASPIEEGRSAATIRGWSA